MTSPLPGVDEGGELGPPGARSLELSVLQGALGVLDQEALGRHDVVAVAAKAPRDRPRRRPGDGGRAIEPGVERRRAGARRLAQFTQPGSEARLLGRAGLQRRMAVLLRGLAEIRRLREVESPCM